MTILSSVKLPVNYLKEIQIFDKALFFNFPVVDNKRNAEVK